MNALASRFHLANYCKCALDTYQYTAINRSNNNSSEWKQLNNIARTWSPGKMLETHTTNKQNRTKKNSQWKKMKTMERKCSFYCDFFSERVFTKIAYYVFQAARVHINDAMEKKSFFRFWFFLSCARSTLSLFRLFGSIFRRFVCIGAQVKPKSAVVERTKRCKSNNIFVNIWFFALLLRGLCRSMHFERRDRDAEMICQCQLAHSTDIVVE